MPRFERLPASALEEAAAVLVATNVFLTACGSSSESFLVTIGRPLRWVSLVALALVALPLALKAWHGRPGRVSMVFCCSAAALVSLALVSTAYSISPRLTLERGVSLALALTTAALLAYAAETRASLARRLIAGLVGGGIVVAAGGLLIYGVDRAAAVQPALPGVPARWRGLGENPNTISLLAAVDLAGALWLAATSDRRRPVWASGAAGLVLTILASGSRGALAAGVAGALCVAATFPRSVSWRLGSTAATVAVTVLGVLFVDAVATPGRLDVVAAPRTTTTTRVITRTSSTGEARTVTTPVVTTVPSSPSSARSFTSSGSSGRIDAWRRAFHLGNGRPALGYGFGTEEIVFIPRFSEFHGSRPENSFLGMYLQLGLAGVAVLVTTLLAACGGVIVCLRRRVSEAPALTGTLAAGLLLLLVQSYVYAIGNVATMTFWIAAMLAASLTGARR